MCADVPDVYMIISHIMCHFMSQTCQCHHHVVRDSCSTLGNTVDTYTQMLQPKAWSCEQNFHCNGLQQPIFIYINQTTLYSPHHRQPIHIYIYIKNNPTQAHLHGLLLPCCLTCLRAQCDMVHTCLALKLSCSEHCCQLCSYLEQLHAPGLSDLMLDLLDTFDC